MGRVFTYDDVEKSCDSFCQEFIIPNGIEEIGEGAFAGLGNIRRIYFPKTLQIINDYAFQDCHNLEMVSFAKRGQFPKMLSDDMDLSEDQYLESTFMEDVSFVGCGKVRDELFKGVRVIGDYAFDSTAIERITLPITLKYLGKFAFANCAELERVSIMARCKIYGNAFYKCFSLEHLEVLNRGFIRKMLLTKSIIDASMRQW